MVHRLAGKQASSDYAIWATWPGLRTVLERFGFLGALLPPIIEKHVVSQAAVLCAPLIENHRPV
ncbi:MAG TPA: hypothetical protein VI756_22730, partial [Blastocatellia bacterium]